METNVVGKSDRKNTTFMRRFNQLRGDRSQATFGKLLGLSAATIGFYENGNRLPNAADLLRIATVCGVSTDWLLGLSKIESPDTTLQGVCKYIGFMEATVVALHNNVLENEQREDRAVANGYPRSSRAANEDMSIVVYSLLKTGFCTDLFYYCLCPPEEQGVITFQTMERKYQYTDSSSVILASYRMRLHNHIDVIADKLRSAKKLYDQDSYFKAGDLGLIDYILANGGGDHGTDEEHP